MDGDKGTTDGGHAMPGEKGDAASPPERAKDFIRAAVAEDLSSGRFTDVVTRFPPEPNGYLHIGHAKAISIDFGVAAEFGGRCNLRFDDTNPSREETEYVESMKTDIRWLGFDWGDRELYASDYFGALHELARRLIEQGDAYVCDLTADEVRAYRGTLTEPGRDSPYRNRSVAENLDLFARMRSGEFPDGSRTLRAKIDMAAANINMRDPVMYRIMHATHHRTGDAWCIYPMYDWAHGQSDSLEGISHSLCDLAYEDHRPLYDWFIERLGIHHPRQIEFARLNVTHTVVSKRKLRRLVEAGLVDGWDDPRMPTLKALRRRGYTPAAIRDFCERVGVAKTDSVVDVQLLEHCVRQDLNLHAPRRMAVLRPLKLVIDNYPSGHGEMVSAVNNPEDPSAGTRDVPFGRELMIEQDDFRVDPPPKYHRLAPGRPVRLRWAYIVTCTGFVSDPETGAVTEVHCTYDPATRGGAAVAGPRVKGTVHWVSAAHAVPAVARLYGRLFGSPHPEEDTDGDDYLSRINRSSLEVVDPCWVEPSLRDARIGSTCQFERLGYFCLDPDTSSSGRLTFNRTVTLRDTWSKEAARA